MTTKKITGLSILVLILNVFLITFLGNKTENTSDLRFGYQKNREMGQKNNIEEYVVADSHMYKVSEPVMISNKETLTESEEKWLVLMREEEKLARDVYLTLADTWNIQIFSNIANSEQTHTDAIKTLLTRYNISDPVTDDSVGVFTNPELAKLYTDLVDQGSKSLLSALKIGATIEDLDINDLDKALLETTKEDIKIVYQNLQKGSRNHLRAFVRQIEKNGGDYFPQYISNDSYEKIISSTQEKGRIE
jgi:hypothetical protein